MTESDHTPNRLVMYARRLGPLERVAEFRWSAESGVSLTIEEPQWGRLARELYEEGVPDFTGTRLIQRTDGAAFMRALAVLEVGSYCRVDEEGEVPDHVDVDSGPPTTPGLRPVSGNPTWPPTVTPQQITQNHPSTQSSEKNVGVDQFRAVHKNYVRADPDNP